MLGEGKGEVSGRKGGKWQKGEGFGSRSGKKIAEVELNGKKNEKKPETVCFSFLRQHSLCIHFLLIHSMPRGEKRILFFLYYLTGNRWNKSGNFPTEML